MNKQTITIKMKDGNTRTFEGAFMVGFGGNALHVLELSPGIAKPGDKGPPKMNERLVFMANANTWESVDVE